MTCLPHPSALLSGDLTLTFSEQLVLQDGSGRPVVTGRLPPATALQHHHHQQQQQQHLYVSEIPGNLHQQQQQQQQQQPGVLKQEQESEQQETEDQLGPLIGGVLGGPTRSLRHMDSDSFKKMIPDHWELSAGQEELDDVLNHLKQG